MESELIRRHAGLELEQQVVESDMREGNALTSDW
jgi:hypothetical protein